MDEFFQLHMTFPETISCRFEDGPQSAFQRCTNLNHQLFDHGVAYQWHGINANKRMIEFLKKSRAGLEPGTETKKERGLKHKMMERMRRMKHKEIYLALHELLPLGTKSDKNSILEMAVKEIEETQQYKEVLCKKNGEMEMILSSILPGNEKAEIKLKVDHPISGIDSMLEVLRCLKTTGCKATAIQSDFSHHQLLAQLEFETNEMRATDVERAVQRTLFEAEMKFRHQL